jgi:N-acetylneuraminate synthase
MKKTLVLVDVGINHNGSVETVKQLVDAAIFAGADAVKFQKRDLNTVYTPEQLAAPRESPWGKTTREQKQGLEFGKEQYDEIDRYCKEHRIPWFASAWDCKSQEFLRQYDCKYNKIASAMLTHNELLQMVADEKKLTFISTGMSTMDEIDAAVEVFDGAHCPFILMHCTSTYPMDDKDANLSAIKTLRDYFSCDVGYSNHSPGVIIPAAAVIYGAAAIEIHLTLDRSLYGTDQSSSFEPMGLWKLVKYIRALEEAIGSGEKVVLEAEKKIKANLRYYQQPQV